MSLLSNFLLEELFEESSKTDFRDKFGEQTFQNFEKARQRLKNKNLSVDYGQYLKMDKEDVDNLILSLYDDEKDAQKKRILRGEDKEIRGKYNYLGEKGGYKIYQPLDVQASMDLGVNTGWCTTGRYGHAGHPDFTPSEKEAARHFNDYTKNYGVKLYYFLNPQTMYGEYAVALYPQLLYIDKIINGMHITATNFELFNANDDLDYSAMDKLPLDDVIPDNNIIYGKLDNVTGYPESLDLLSIEEVKKLPEDVRKSGNWWWLRSPGGDVDFAAIVSNIGNVRALGRSVFHTYCVRPALKVSNLKSSNLEFYETYTVNNEFDGIYIGDNKFLYNGEPIDHIFDLESNDYKTSEIKQFLDDWLQRLQSKSKDMKESLTGIADRMKLLEELFEESAKTDFRDKFGEQTLQNFDKARQRLKNNNLSVDYGQYLKMDKEEVDNLILSLYDDKKDAQRKRMIKGEDKEIRGEYNYLGEKGGYKIYQPLDVQASMDLGVNTGWCTTGRYGHYGHPEFTPSEEDAAEHFNIYTEQFGVKLYYFLNPQTMYGEYAVALYPNMLDVNKEINGMYVSTTNFELFNAEDELDYRNMDKLPLDVIPNIDIVSHKLDIVSGYPESLELLSIEEAIELPKSVKKYDEWWWLRSPGWGPNLATCVLLNGYSVDNGDFVYIGGGAARPALKISNPEPSNLELYKTYNVNNVFTGIYIGDNKFLYTGKVIRRIFDEESNNYETSKIKQFLNYWLKELQSKSKSMKESLRNNRMRKKYLKEDLLPDEVYNTLVSRAKKTYSVGVYSTSKNRPGYHYEINTENGVYTQVPDSEGFIAHWFLQSLPQENMEDVEEVVRRIVDEYGCREVSLDEYKRIINGKNESLIRMTESSPVSKSEDEELSSEIIDFINTKKEDMTYALAKKAVDSYYKDYKEHFSDNTADLLNMPYYSKEKFYKKYRPFVDKCKEFTSIQGITGYGGLRDYERIKIMELCRAVDYQFPYGWKPHKYNESLKEDVDKKNIEFTRSNIVKVLRNLGYEADVVSKRFKSGDYILEFDKRNNVASVYPLGKSDEEYDNIVDALKVFGRKIWTSPIKTCISIYGNESLTEDTVKTRDGKWTNKGKEGTHGKFKTKKAADAQRKAMFANGYREALEDDSTVWTATDIVRDLHKHFPEVDFYDERYVNNDDTKVALFFEIRGHDVDIDALDAKIKSYGVKPLYKGPMIKIVAPEDSEYLGNDMKESLSESFEKGSFVVVDNHYPDCEYQKSFNGGMIVCCTYKVIDDLGDKLLCRDPRRRYSKGTTLGELIDKEDILFSSDNLYEAQSFHSNFVKNFDYDKVKSAKVNESLVKSLKEDFYWDEEDSFFTRDDLDEFQAELEDEIPDVIFHKTYLEPGNSLEVDWEYEGYDETTKVRVDMRRIRYPRDLIRRYAPIVVGMIKNSCAEIDRELNESLRSRRYRR